MSKLPGIEGILGNYVTTPPKENSQAVAPTRMISDKQTAKTKADSKRREPARLGRPPGNHRKKSRPKEKATLRIDIELMAEYRDWSWDARCQLGELIERALAEYRKRHR